MTLYFITGNPGKFEEVKSILGDVERIDMDLPEIQETDAHMIIKEKLLSALEHHEGEFIVEDTSVFIDSLNGLPGPLIKWFLKSIGDKGVADMASKMGDKGEVKTIIGYAKNKDDIHFFEGSVKGRIVAPRGDGGFGWDKIFEPDGYSETFGEMTREAKNRISMRRIALNKLKDFLEQ
ncbi:non-canonical purine NTP pyrophosphatase [Thermoproteota archaeon]